jgi:hypothetical protein
MVAQAKQDQEVPLQVDGLWSKFGKGGVVVRLEMREVGGHGAEEAEEVWAGKPAAAEEGEEEEEEEEEACRMHRFCAIRLLQPSGTVLAEVSVPTS